MAPFSNLRPSPDSISSGITRGITNSAPLTSSTSAPAKTTLLLALAALVLREVASSMASEGSIKSVLKASALTPFLP